MSKDYEISEINKYNNNNLAQLDEAERERIQDRDSVRIPSRANMSDAQVRAGHKSFATSARGLAMLDRAATRRNVDCAASVGIGYGYNLGCVNFGRGWPTHAPATCVLRVWIPMPIPIEVSAPPIGRPVMLDWSLLVESGLWGPATDGLYAQWPMGAHWAAQRAATRSLSLSLARTHMCELTGMHGMHACMCV